MRNLNSLANNKNSVRSSVAIIGLAGIVLAACSSNAEERSGMGPGQRYKYDYVSNDVFGDQCLDDTGYNSSKVVVTRDEQGNILVTPSSAQLHSLVFTGLADTSRPLQPVDEYTKNVLQSYDCALGKDGSDRN